MCPTAISRRIGKTKDAFQMIGILIRDRKRGKRRKEYLNGITSILLYGSECWAISKTKKRFDATDIRLYRKMLWIPLTEYVNNNEVLDTIDTTKVSHTKHQEVAVENSGVRNGEDWVRNGMMKGTRNMLDELMQMDVWTGFERNNKKIKLIKSNKGQEAVKATMAYVLNGHGT